jgi:hypothetical protein
MKYEYIIDKDPHSGIIITEFLDDKKNIVWELSFILQKKMYNFHYFNIENIFHSNMDRCFNWLKENHPELLI